VCELEKERGKKGHGKWQINCGGKLESHQRPGKEKRYSFYYGAGGGNVDSEGIRIGIKKLNDDRVSKPIHIRES